MDRPSFVSLVSRRLLQSASRWSSTTQLQIQVLHEESEVKNDYVREWMRRAFAYRIVRKVFGALAVLGVIVDVISQSLCIAHRVPVGEPDPVVRLAAVRATTAGLKERKQAVGASTLMDLTQYAAPTLLGLAARAVHHQRFFNVVSTNVPGPQTPLYCMGARMLEAYPMVPLARNLGLGIAILSYCGSLQIGLLADGDTFPDLDVLATGLEDAFAALRKVADDASTARDVSEERVDEPR